MQQSCTTRSFLYLILIALLAASLYFLIGNRANPIPTVDISKVVQEVNQGQVSKITVSGTSVNVQLKDSSQQNTTIESNAKITDYGISPDKVDISVKNTSSSGVWLTILSALLPVLLIGGFIYFMLRSAQGANNRALSFGKISNRLVKPNGKKVTFDDVAGLEESKEELVEVVDFLKNPNKFKKLGAEIPKGVLLLGPPGCGKTLLAKAVAGEAVVPFFSISGSEFVEMFVGVGASRVRDLFNKAKRNAPSIIFVDEIDAVGRQRGSGLGGSHDEREQTLNQILVEMDGFDTNTNVIVIAATNRPDVLDPALLRPGRFDRRVIIDLPDKEERIKILKVHSKEKPLESSVSFEKVAAACAGFSGADLRNLMNEAAILAARHGKRTISMSDINSSIEKVMLGPERKSRRLTEKEKKITAYHETGHALVSKLLLHTDPVHKVSIISRGMALGYTWNLPTEDKHIQSKAKFEDDLAAMLAGRAAEKLIFDELTTGAENDLKKATSVARKMVSRYGMSEKIGPVNFGQDEELIFLGKELAEHKTYSERVASEIDAEVTRIIKNAEQRATKILVDHKNKLEEIAKVLLQKETIESDEFDNFFPESKKKQE